MRFGSFFSCGFGLSIIRFRAVLAEEVFVVDHGSLYLALQRLEDSGLIDAKWGTSENNRKARFYTLTAKGRAQLVAKTSQWKRLTKAMTSVLSPLGEEV